MMLKTMSGRLIDILNPDQNVIDIDDIVIGLSQQNRYAGQTPVPFSVGQHIIAIMAYIDDEMPSLEDRYRRAALMHDFPEYVLQDLTNPFKIVLSQYTNVYDDLTIRWENAIVQRFGWFESGRDYRQAYDEHTKQLDRECYFAEAVHLNLPAHNIERHHPTMLLAVQWAAGMSISQVQQKLRYYIQREG